MPFKLRHLCDLLQLLDDNRIKKRATFAQAKNSDNRIILSWFKKHDGQIPRHGAAAVAFLSCLFPERRADRVYNVQEKRLEKIVGRILRLGATRLNHLRSWRTTNGADFAQTVQNVMSQAEFDRPRPDYEVTLEEIDALFDRAAAWYSGSSPDLRARISNPIAADKALQPLLLRLQGIEAKWLIRMFLKQYTPVELPERLVLRQFHCLLPDILCLQNCFTAAVRCLDDPQISYLPPRPQSEGHEQAVKLKATPHLKPQVGVMVQRSSYNKARSIQHCCEMAGRRRISAERKYDGEYCQVHIDMAKGKDCIKIFSKSGKDSTQDRVRLHGAIESTLRIGTRYCPVKKQCILEGELLIWHEKKQQIQPFEKIRKHVTRNGRFLGADHDSPRDLQEKVMIMFYDLLLFDDIVCLSESLEQRRSRLRSLIRRLPGQAELGYREKINFASSDAKSLIRRAFAKCISRGWEGFVLKGCDDPYFSLVGSSSCIKLKKDYIAGLGDMADLAIVGGRREAKDVQALNIGKLNWTTFYLACLENRDQVQRFSAKPRFRIVGIVSAEKHTLSPDRVRLLNDLGQFGRLPCAPVRAEMDVRMDLKIAPPTELFKNPFVVEVVGGGFEKPSNVTYYSLRFPRVTKIHEDRSWSDVMTFVELQVLAEESLAMAANEDSQEDCEWIAKLIQADPRSKFVADNSGSTGAGRDHTSTTTASATPTAAQSSLSPLLVRIDTQEMTEQEHRGRDQYNGALHPSYVLPTAATTSCKRAADRDDQSPTANMSTKRQRLSAADGGISVSNAPSDRSSGLSPSLPQPRTPLVEIPNTSLPPKFPLARVYSERQSPFDARNDSSTVIVSSSSKANATDTAPMFQPEKFGVLPSVRAEGKILGEAPLPTPPKSSALERGSQDARAVLQGRASSVYPAEQREAEEAQKNNVTEQSEFSSDEEQPPLTLSMSILQNFSSMIFVSPPVLTRPSSKDHHALVSNLANVKAPLTLSGGVFLNSIKRAPSRPHIAIVDMANAEETGKEIRVFHQLLSLKLEDGQLTGAGRLIFLDWKSLQHFDADELSDDIFQPGFAGCLAWRCGFDVAGKRIWGLRDIWRWEEVRDQAN